MLIDPAHTMEELADRVEWASGADRELDAEIFRAVGNTVAEGWEHRIDRYTESLDAALTLKENEDVA